MYEQCLEQAVFAAFKQALSEGHADVADHLLKALEALCAQPELNAAVAQAYSDVANSRRVH